MGFGQLSRADAVYGNRSAIVLRDTLSRPTLAQWLTNKSQKQELQQEVFAVVDDLKRMDWPPERVIIAVKQIARDGGLVPSLHFVSAGASLSDGDAVLA